MIAARRSKAAPARSTASSVRSASPAAVDPALAAKLVEIAGKCPVHRTLEAGAAVVTKVVDNPQSA